MTTISYNFERLEGMYHESLEEVNQVKSEYEAKLIRANDNQAVIMAENEALKEKVDILFKLGRSYIDSQQGRKKTPKSLRTRLEMMMMSLK